MAFRFFATLSKTVLALAAAAVLTSCSSYPSGPIHGDNDPHPGVARARALPIQGMDIARYQGNVDFYKARAAGMHFVFIKATEGKDYLDPSFYDNWRKAQAAGIARGAYHFMTWCSLASEQAAWFVQMVPADPDALPPVLDLEWNNHSSCTVKPSKADAVSYTHLTLPTIYSV